MFLNTGPELLQTFVLKLLAREWQRFETHIGAVGRNILIPNIPSLKLMAEIKMLELETKYCTPRHCRENLLLCAAQILKNCAPWRRQSCRQDRLDLTVDCQGRKSFLLLLWRTATGAVGPAEWLGITDGPLTISPKLKILLSSRTVAYYHHKLGLVRGEPLGLYIVQA
jgi:hypothetical protein